MKKKQNLWHFCKYQRKNFKIAFKIMFFLSNIKPLLLLETMQLSKTKILKHFYIYKKHFTQTSGNSAEL